MSVNEELNEEAEKAREPFDKRVALSMAIIAALLAIVSVLGHLLSNEELLAQQRASDQWAFYQAKDIRRYDSEIALDFLKAMKDGSLAERVQHYSENAEKYDHDRAEIQKEATQLQEESKLKGRQALRLETSEVFLEVGIVFASLAILTKRTIVWGTSLVSAAAGVAIAFTTLAIH